MGLLRSLAGDWRARIGGALVVIGVSLLALPRHWIEGRSGAEPGDDGVFELVIGVTPLVLGALLVASAVARCRRASSSRFAERQVR